MKYVYSDNMVESIIDVINKYGLSCKVEYDEKQHFCITVDIPYHYFEIIQYDCNPDDNDIHNTLDNMYEYVVYRNDGCVFSGNDSYGSVFVMLLDTMFNDVVND